MFRLDKTLLFLAAPLSAMRLLLGGILCLFCLAATAAASSGPRDLPQSYLFTPAGVLTALKAHSTYQSSLFPIAIRLTPSAGWAGAQWKSGTDYFRGGGPPNFGWVHIGRGTVGVPQGLISIMTAYAHTPSVAATVNTLRTRGHGATYQATTPVNVGGFSGVQFDGEIVGAKNFDHIGHYFIPFSPKSSAAKYYPDEYGVYGDVFRVIVLDVRGKTLVIYIEHPVASRFSGFLTQANTILQSLRFPVS
jgi:hypothetical protein